MGDAYEAMDAMGGPIKPTGVTSAFDSEEISPGPRMVLFASMEFEGYDGAIKFENQAGEVVLTMTEAKWEQLDRPTEIEVRLEVNAREGS